MNGNAFGTIFRVSTYGESHGPAVGAVIDGCPSGVALAAADFLEDMQRRSGGAQPFTTPRAESDHVEIESGVYEGVTTGTPIALRVRNETQKSSDYEAFRHLPRPGHADLTTHLKHGHRDHRGGGRSSARETVARVAAGVVAKKILRHEGIEILAWVSRVGPHALASVDALPMASLKQARDASPLLAPAENSLLVEVEKLRERHDSWGGALRCRVEGLPAGLGEPVFDKLQALLGHALLSLPAAVAFAAGGGEALSRLPGSAIRDAIGPDARPESNRHGGLLGGMTSGLPLFLDVAFHAPTSIPQPIKSVHLQTNNVESILVGGRHDAFPLPRAVPMVEAMVAITLVDALLRAGRLRENLGVPAKE